MKKHYDKEAHETIMHGGLFWIVIVVVLWYLSLLR